MDWVVIGTILGGAGAMLGALITLAHFIGARRQSKRETAQRQGDSLTPASERAGSAAAPAAGVRSEAPGTPLPTGTVTFFFSDIEGSTLLLSQLGDRYAEVLRNFRRLLRESGREHDGHEVDTQGDAIFMAFSRARDAVSAAVQSQRAIAAHSWPIGADVRVRMGLHTGEPLRGADGYVGIDVHRASRICSAAHGGQILMSRSTRELVEEDLPVAVSLRDLGEHRLRDLSQSERISQVIVPGLPTEFPLLKSLGGSLHNLPLQLASFVGREREIAEVKQQLSRARLLTLTGVGGSGKTRLALQVAGDVLSEYPDGVWLVELAALADPSHVLQTVAAAFGVLEQQGRHLTELVVDYLRPRSLLLVLDNCEHLLTACAEVTNTLLQACPSVKILATSREGLGVAGEVMYRVPSLSLPTATQVPALDQLRRFDAVQLFTERAAALVPTFKVTSENGEAVARICQQLDGMPLAIELAAARVKVLPVEQIASRLSDRFRLLTGGSLTALARHHTLRAAMDWSYDLLDQAERALLRRTAVFAGGFSLEAAEAVCCGDGIDQFEVLDLLARLVDKSLILVVEGDGNEVRYRLLETVRQYAGDRLRDSGEERAIRTRHRDWCMALAESAEPSLRGPQQAHWVNRLDQERQNLWAGLEWSLSNGEEERVLSLASALHWYWFTRSQFTEGRRWLEEGLASPRVGPAVRAKGLLAAGVLAWGQNDLPAAIARLEQSAALFREQNNKLGVAHALVVWGIVLKDLGDHGRGSRLLEESLSLFRTLDDHWGIALATDGMAFVALLRQELDAAVAYWQESLAHSRELKYTQGMAYAIQGLGVAAQVRGELARGWTLYEECLFLYREVGDRRGEAVVLMRLGDLSLLQGRYDEARGFHQESLDLRKDLGDKPGIANSLNSLGFVSTFQGNLERAAALHKESLDLCRDGGDTHGVLEALEGLAWVARAKGNDARALRMFSAIMAQRDALQVTGGIVPLYQRVHERDRNRLLAAIEEALGKVAFSAIWAEGRALTLAQILATTANDGGSAA